MIRCLWILLLAVNLGLSGCSFVRLSAVEASLAPGSETATEHQIGVMEDHWVIVEALIDGQGPYRLILDTGADATILKPEICQELGLERIGSVRMADIRGHKVMYDLLRADLIEIGPVRLRGMRVVSGERLMELFEKYKVDGVLGYYGLDDFTLDLDYPNGVARVSTEALELGQPGVMAMSGRRGATPVVRLAHAGFDGDRTLDLKYGIDSGGHFVLSPPQNRIGQLVDSRFARDTGRSAGANGISLSNRMGLLHGSVEIGEYEVRNIPVDLDHAHALIGTGLLSMFRVQIDPQSRLVRFSKQGIEGGIATYRLPYGIGIIDHEFAKDGQVILRVGPHSPAMLAGLRPGDVVIEVGGVAVTEPEAYERLGWVANEPETLHLLVEREGERFEVEVGMEPFFPASDE